MPGKLVIFSAPSGAGKTTLVHHLLNKEFDLEFSISATTRERRPNEIHGKDYYFYSLDTFKKFIEQDKFIEWEEVYKNGFYGTLEEEIERIWAKGHHVIFDVDVDGGINLKKIFGDRALAIFVKPPSINALEERLRKRETETEQSIKRRIEKAPRELEKAKFFDVIIVNENLEKAKLEAEDEVLSFLKK